MLTLSFVRRLALGFGKVLALVVMFWTLLLAVMLVFGD